ncbi:MAG: serine/threonine protein kinase, partial [bacterium]
MIALTNKQILDGKYEIIHEIKKGGFGIVYYGIDNHLNKPVAIKEIAPSLLEEPKYLDMFQEEALNIAKLSHNNIVHIYELKKSADGRLFIIMEYIDGIDLEKVTRIVKKTTKRIPTHLAIYIVAEICMALDYAHHRRDAFTNKALNLVHQDISPSNIMISRFGGVKLIDFGIASVKRHQTKEKRDHKLRGKIPYMSPEQLIMGNHPDHRSDLYSLGLVLYEILVGERLFNSQEEVIAAAKNPKWFKKAIRGKKLPFPLEKILSKALEIDISKRYQNANHMYIDLLQYLISCNETGELMDSLADYINVLLENNGKHIFPGNHNQTDTSGKVEDASQPYPSSPPIQNRWNAVVSDNKKEPNELESTQHLKPETHRLTHISNQSTNDLTDEEEEDLKTVIDVIRISARNSKKRFKQFALAALTGIVIFLTLDTLNGWTKAGTGIFD